MLYADTHLYETLHIPFTSASLKIPCSRPSDPWAPSPGTADHYITKPAITANIPLLRLAVRRAQLEIAALAYR
jgi:hypothetical protein